MSRYKACLYLVLALAFAAGSLRCGKSIKAEAQDGTKPADAAKSADGNGAGKKEYAVPVAVKKMERKSISEYVGTVGTIAPVRSIAVKAEESGRIAFTKPWREGQMVKEGELLARLDAEETSRDLEISRADLDSAQSDVSLALERLERSVADFQRAEAMYKKGQISRKAYEEREFTASSAKIGYESSVIRAQRARKTLERLQLQISRRLVPAPMTGYLVGRDQLERRANPSAADSADVITDLEGRLVGTGSIICGVVDLSNILIRCDITSKDISRIRKGQKALAHVYSDHEVAVEGAVTDVSPIMDVETRAFEVDVAVPNPDGVLRPGMFARVNIIINTRRDALVVDRKILQRRNNEDIVFVASDEERAEKRVVRLGLENPDEIEVVSGLRAGENLVVLGYETLQDKVKIKVMETEPALADKDGATTSGSTTKKAEVSG